MNANLLIQKKSPIYPLKKSFHAARRQSAGNYFHIYPSTAKIVDKFGGFRAVLPPIYRRLNSLATC